MAAHNQRMADRIRRERMRVGLSEAELAWKVGASERQVRRWEGAESEPRPANLRALAREFKLEVEDIRPDLEAEEQAVAEQLDRIEDKLDRLLAALRLDPEPAEATGESEAVGRGLDELAPQPSEQEQPDEADGRSRNGRQERPPR